MEPGRDRALEALPPREIDRDHVRTLKEYVWKAISAGRTAWRLGAQRYEDWNSSRARGVAMS